MKGFEKYDGLGLAQLVRKKQVKPEELLESSIARIERLNPQINAVITKMYDQARFQIRRGLSQGPFTGVPFLLKDLLAMYEGVPMSFGAKLFKGFKPDHDSELTLRYKDAGLVILGKTNTPELGIQPTTEPQAFGPTRNPWNLERSAGGSSGGAAAAVAVAMVPMAHGSDGGGSIRIPASCCGVFGMKPTRGRVTLGPDIGDIASGLVVEHALTRSVRDSAYLLEAVMGPSPGDPYCAVPPRRYFREVIELDPAPLRIAFTAKAPNGAPVHPDCKQALASTVKLLEDLGHHLSEEKIPDLDKSLEEAFFTVWMASTANGIASVERVTGITLKGDLFEPMTWALAEEGRKRSAVDYLISVRRLQTFSRHFARTFGDFDLWLTPTLAQPPVVIGALDSSKEDPLRGFYAGAEFVAFTPLANATGQPAMSVPLFWGEQGLPIGVQFIARYGEEDTLFQLAAQLERARPWAERYPPVF
jgi:amidase